MNTGRFSAGASRFAHFAGLSRRSRRAAESDDDQRNDNTRADDDDEGKDASDDDRDIEDGEGKDASDDDRDTEDGEDKPAGRQGRRARRAEDDDDGKDASDDDDGDDDQDELNGKCAKAQARRREQSRITHILSSPAAANNLALAVSLACETRMSRRQAVKVLQGQGGGRRGDDGGDRRDRDAGNRHARRDRADRNVALGSDAVEPSDKQVVKSSWDAAWKKAGVKLG